MRRSWRGRRSCAVFYGAGSIRGWVTEAVWERGIVVTAAYAANAVPVAEWTVAQIVLSLKQAWFFVLEGKRRGGWVRADERKSAGGRGGYGSVVGLVSLGVIGRRVAEMLKGYDVHVIAYDPYVSAAEGAGLGVEMVNLAEVFGRADVVSIHTPWLKETEGLITGELIGSMKAGATLINTARGAVVREGEMVGVLERRGDLTAVLDVTQAEPPGEGSKLYTLGNVVLTPHVAGSIGGECARMGRYMVEELGRWLRGEPLQWQVTRERAGRMA